MDNETPETTAATLDDVCYSLELLAAAIDRNTDMIDCHRKALLNVPQMLDPSNGRRF
jgi:hypothetical protein